jgi:hypothetical protein
MYFINLLSAYIEKLINYDLTVISSIIYYGVLLIQITTKWQIRTWQCCWLLIIITNFSRLSKRLEYLTALLRS